MDGLGGAAIGAYGLHRALIDRGAESEMLVIRKKTDDLTVEQVGRWYRYARVWMRKIEILVLSFQMTSNEAMHTLNIFPTEIAFFTPSSVSYVSTRNTQLSGKASA